MGGAESKAEEAPPPEQFSHGNSIRNWASQGATASSQQQFSSGNSKRIWHSGKLTGDMVYNEMMKLHLSDSDRHLMFTVICEVTIDALDKFLKNIRVNIFLKNGQVLTYGCGDPKSILNVKYDHQGEVKVDWEEKEFFLWDSMKNVANVFINFVKKHGGDRLMGIASKIIPAIKNF